MAREAMLDLIGEDYSALLVGAGVSDDGQLIEVLVNAETRTWTIVFSSGNGLSCSLATGDDWQQRTPVPTGPDA